jgi:hypothetical protein
MQIREWRATIHIVNAWWLAAAMFIPAGLFRGIPNGLGIIKPPAPDAANAMGECSLCLWRPNAARRRTVRNGLRLCFYLSPRGAGQILPPARRAPSATVSCPRAPLFWWAGRVGFKEMGGTESGTAGDLAGICVTSYVTGPWFPTRLLACLPAHPKQEIVRPGL